MWRVSRQVTKGAQCMPSSLTTPGIVSSSSLTSPRHQSVRHESKAASESSSPPPPPPKSGGSGLFWKILGLTVVGSGGIVGYAWYDSSFRKSIETNVPYSKDALGYIFKYLPASSTPSPAPSKKSEQISMQKKTDAIPAKVTPAPAKEVVQQKAPVSPSAAAATAAGAGPVALKMDAKKSQEEAKRVAEEKKRQEKERAEQTIREQEEKELVENKELEFLLEKLTGDSVRSVEAAVASFKTAAQSIRTHNQQLKHAMESSSKESEWTTASDTHQSRTDAIFAAETANNRAKQNIEKLRETIVDGKERKSTKKKKVPTATLR